MTETIKLNFSQRNGIQEMPTQLEVGVLPKKTRYKITEFINQIIERNSKQTAVAGYSILNYELIVILKHIWIENFEKRPSEFLQDATSWKKLLETKCEMLKPNDLFDLLEELLSFSPFSSLGSSLATLLRTHCTAYSYVSGIFITITNEHVSNAFQDGMNAAKNSGNFASRTHLTNAANNLRSGNWADSIRESIHAVESLVGKMDIKQRTLGGALSEIEKCGHLHKSLKNGFSALYGYTCDEAGIRHALLGSDAPSVSEADAIYMLGSCASFVTYLIAQEIPEA